MNQRTTLGLAAAILLSLAALSYAVPFVAQGGPASLVDYEAREIKTYDQAYVLQGQAPRDRLDTSLSFLTEMPAWLAAGAYEVMPRMKWRLEGTGDNQGNELKLEFTAVLGESKKLALRHTNSQRGPGTAFEHAFNATEFRTECPCRDPTIGFDVSIRLANTDSDGQFSYTFRPILVGVTFRPLDADGDGIVQTSQWFSFLPQYSFPLLFGAAAALPAYAAWRKGKRSDAGQATDDATSPGQPHNPYPPR